jgi:methyl-accepting chemotaxis protein
MNNWKIGTRITAGFSAVVAITILLGWYGFNRAQNIDKSQVVIAGNYLPSVVALSHVESNTFRSVDLMLAHARSSSNSEMDQIEEKIAALKDANEKSFQTYEALPSDANESNMYDTVKQEKLAFWKIWDQIRTHSRVGTDAENKIAKTMIDEQLRPQLNRYVDATQAVIDYDMKGCQDGLGLINGAVGSAEHGMLIGILVSTTTRATRSGRWRGRSIRRSRSCAPPSSR